MHENVGGSMVRILSFFEVCIDNREATSTVVNNWAGEIQEALGESALPSSSVFSAENTVSGPLRPPTKARWYMTRVYRAGSSSSHRTEQYMQLRVQNIITNNYRKEPATLPKWKPLLILLSLFCVQNCCIGDIYIRTSSLNLDGKSDGISATP